MPIQKSIDELKKYAQLNKHKTQLNKHKLSNILGGSYVTDGTNIIITDIYVG